MFSFPLAALVAEFGTCLSCSGRLKRERPLLSPTLSLYSLMVSSFPSFFSPRRLDDL